jgi:pSer/pThr/pTyr-binding forkhead associated (FHA) protein
MMRDEAYTETHLAVDVNDEGEVPLLVVVRGTNVGSRFALTSMLTTIGRHPESDVFLDDVTVSRRHAEVRREPDGHLELVDVGSLNGTYVNNERIERTDLAEGDQVQVGKFRLVVVVGGPGVVD